MASEARIAANRLNAQKSTGPRTAAGKAVVAQNAVKHGLLAREGLLRGEDREEYETHREALLEELNPTGALEVILAARIVDLTWRLHRAAQDRSETFGALYDRHTAGLRPGEAGLCPGEAGAPEPEEPAQRGAILGRMILEDYSGSAVLERLLRCERRIEGSLFRNLGELRRVHDQGRKADAEAASTLARWREEDDQARKTRAFAPWRGADGPNATDVAAGDQMCQTNPIGSAPGGPGVPAVGPDHGQDAHGTHGRDAHATEPTDPGGTDTPRGQLCQTNPIGPEPDTTQVMGCTTVMSSSACEGVWRTNPIGSTPGGTGGPSRRSQSWAGRPCYGDDGAGRYGYAEGPISLNEPNRCGNFKSPV